MKFDLNFKISVAVTLLFFILLPVVYFVKNKQYHKELFQFIADNNFSQGDYFESSKYYRKLIAMGAGNETVYTNMAISMVKLGYYDRGIEYLKKVLKSANTAQIYYSIGYAYFQKAQTINSIPVFNKALGYINESITLDKQSIDGYRMMGRIFERMQKFDRARIWYNKALSVIADKREFYNLIAYTYMQQNDLDNAAVFYKKGTENNDKNLQAYCALGEIYRQKSDFNLAMEYYKKAIDTDSGYIIPYYKIGQIYYDAKDYEEALLWYGRALLIDNNNNIVNYCIGTVYKDKGMKDKAVSYFKTAAYCGNDDAIKELRDNY